MCVTHSAIAECPPSNVSLMRNKGSQKNYEIQQESLKSVLRHEGNDIALTWLFTRTGCRKHERNEEEGWRLSRVDMISDLDFRFRSKLGSSRCDGVIPQGMTPSHEERRGVTRAEEKDDARRRRRRRGGWTTTQNKRRRRRRTTATRRKERRRNDETKRKMETRRRFFDPDSHTQVPT